MFPLGICHLLVPRPPLTLAPAFPRSSNEGRRHGTRTVSPAHVASRCGNCANTPRQPLHLESGLPRPLPTSPEVFLGVPLRTRPCEENRCWETDPPRAAPSGAPRLPSNRAVSPSREAAALSHLPSLTGRQLRRVSGRRGAPGLAVRELGAWR